MRVIDEIERQLPGRNDLRVWYLGGNSLVLQTSSARLYIDPFLVPAALHDGLFRRRDNPPVAAGEVRLVDGILITHEHGDHCNRHTLRELLSTRSVPVIAPKVSAEIVRSVSKFGVLQVVQPRDSFELAGFTITVCESGDTVAADPVSFLIRYREFHLYIAGDSLFLPTMDLAARQRIDVAFLAIATNPPGKRFYVSPQQWAEMARRLSPRYAVPVHWDVWADYNFDPATLNDHYCEPGLRIVPVGGHLDLRGNLTRSE